MKRVQLLILPLLLITLSLPQSSSAAAEPHPGATEHHNAHHHRIIKIIDKYAPADFAAQMKQDLAQHRRLSKEWRQSSDFQHRRAEHQLRQKQIAAIKKAQMQGKLTHQEADQKIARLKTDGKCLKHRQMFKALHAAVAKNDRPAVLHALKQWDKALRQSNHDLAEKLKK